MIMDAPDTLQDAGLQSRRPVTVTAAVVLLCATQAVGVVRAVVFPNAGDEGDIVAFKFGVLAVTAGVALLLAYKIFTGRNWARLTFAVIFLLGLVSVALLTGPSQQFGPVFFLQAALQSAAFVLLFLKPSVAWFRAVKSLRRPGGQWPPGPPL